MLVEFVQTATKNDAVVKLMKEEFKTIEVVRGGSVGIEYYQYDGTIVRSAGTVSIAGSIVEKTVDPAFCNGNVPSDISGFNDKKNGFAFWKSYDELSNNSIYS